ncbi:MAG: hypothetical protein KDA42_08390, partial [Planctomycetales bacterium]|nr:hypothetical protein [Planctomycetales bacterium]
MNDNEANLNNDPAGARAIRFAVAKRLALLAGAIVVACLLAEVLLRVFVEQETKRLAVYDVELGWRGRPNGTGIYV